MSGLDWAALLRAGLRGLGLKPDEFWALSPAELALMLGQQEGRARMDRAGLSALSKAYPDKVKGKKDD